ncbi:MAG: prephenate dehydratase domain-containing protein [Candidatus Paceibacterota bacterium]
MKRILVLDAFTNGHEAAIAFMRRQGWLDAECVLLFCGSFDKLLARLARESVYAVVPVRNSTIEGSEITEVTRPLAALRAKGLHLAELDRVVLPVEHHLLVQACVESAAELECVLTYRRAFEQCQRYLDNLGIPHDRRLRRNSTAGAAKIVSQLGDQARFAAIASRLAAEAYGLRILAQGIQDDPDNKTTFVLLKHVANGHCEGARR